MPDFAARLGPNLDDAQLSARLGMLAARGFDAVELSAVSPVLGEGLRRHGLAPVVLDTETGTLIGDPRRRAEFRGIMAAAVAAARTVGCWHVNCRVGAVPAGVARDTAIKAVIGNVRDAAHLAQPLGLRVLLEPMTAGTAVLTQIAEAVAVLDLAQARNASLLLNVSGLSERDEPMTKLLPRYLPRIGHIRLGDRALDDVVRFIDATGYRGWIGCDEDGLLDRFPPKSARGLVWGMPKEALRLSA